MARRNGWYKIGHCPVDSGQLMIVDPCYLHTWIHELDYEKVCNVTLSEDRAGTTEDGVAFSSGCGDGDYNVWAYYDNSEVVEVRVLMGWRPPPAHSDIDLYGKEYEPDYDY